ncbi:MAG: FAD-dependent oxidoreductase [Desulfobacterales bacterium]|jgi:oxygen-dependent protoporphyrinogen oxidase
MIQRDKISPDVAIVGSGISGLAAGYHLTQAGFKPVLFESGSFVGGRMSSETVDGFIIDKAAYTIPEFYRNLKGFAGQMGLNKSLVPTSGTAATFYDGKQYRIKIGSPSDFLTYKLLSIKSKKDILKLFLYARSLGKALNLDRPTQKTFELENESVTDFLCNHYDEQILERIAYPILCEILLGSPESNSKASLLALLRNLSKFKIFAFDNGMGTLPSRIKLDLDIRLNSPVRKITKLGEKGPYEIEVGGIDSSLLTFDAIVLAIPLPLVPRLIERLPQKLNEYFRSVIYAPSIVVATATDDKVEDVAMINNLLRSEFDILGNVVFDQHKGPQRVPPGKTLATCILQESASRRLLHETDQKIAKLVLMELDAVFPKFSNKMIFQKIYRWEYGALQLPPGHLAKRDAVRGFIENGWQNIYFAGESFPISSLEASFNSGINAANQIIIKSEKNR